MTRLLAWSFGATAGYVVGWLAGSNVLKLAEGRRLGRPEPRTGAGTGGESREPLIGRENGAQRIGLAGLVNDPAWWSASVTLPAQRDGEPCPITLGPLTCPFTGPHTSHAFQSPTSAPDRKADADEEVE